MSGYDYIVVGAGTSGCVLAEQLSRDPACQVLLIEAGGRGRHPVYHVPKGFALSIENEKYSYVYPVEPYGPLNQTETWSRGRTLGGSSAINGMIYNRGWQDDFDSIVELGNPGWGWDDILQIYRELEDHQLGASETRGAGGPLRISIDVNGNPVNEAMLDAAEKAGLARVEDANASDEERVGYTPANIHRGIRQSTPKVFLKAAANRSNLTVRTGAQVTRILCEGDKAVGIEARTRSGLEEVHANREIILSLGNIETPKLLELSGIGRYDVLKAAGIDVRVDSPNVGENVIEHRWFPLQLRLNDAKLGYNRLLSSQVGQAVAAMRWAATRKGPIGSPAYDLVGFLKTNPDEPRVDAQILLTPFSQGIQPLDISLESRPGATIIGYPLRPTTTGSQHIVSRDPNMHPRIVANYDYNAHDRRKIVDLFRRMRNIAEQAPFADLIHGEALPGFPVQDEDSIMRHVLLNGGTAYHACGAVAMGPDDDAPVDATLRVRGISGLRVMDASVLPVMVAGNLNAPLMAMSVQAARIILGDA